MEIRTFLACYDSGHYRERMGRGPERILEFSLKPLLGRLGHRMVQEEITVADSYLAEISTAFALSRIVAERVRSCRAEGAFPVVLSGNCNTAVGALAGCGCQNTAMVWFDAHGECNTPETTASGFLDGMGISILTGQSWRKLALSIPEFKPLAGPRVLLVGSRDIEPDESAALDQVGVVRAGEIDALTSHLKALSREVNGAYVHVDLDILNPSEGIANQWAPPGGWTVEALKNAMKTIRAHTAIKGLGIASYDPELDHEGKVLTAASAMAEAVLGVVS